MSENIIKEEFVDINDNSSDYQTEYLLDEDYFRHQGIEIVLTGSDQYVEEYVEEYNGAYDVEYLQQDEQYDQTYEEQCNSTDLMSQYVVYNIEVNNNWLYCLVCKEVFGKNVQESHICSQTSMNETHSKFELEDEDDTNEDDQNEESNFVKLHICIVCRKLFRSSENFSTHFQTHAKDIKNLEAKPEEIGVKKPLFFVCEVCNKTFKRKNFLKMHKLKHSNDKPYGCTKCNRQFPRKNALIRHELLHMNKKPYGCEICGKKFIQTSDLKRHRSTHFDERPYPCDHCEKSYKILNSLSKHKQRKHCNV